MSSTFTITDKDAETNLLDPIIGRQNSFKLVLRDVTVERHIRVWGPSVRERAKVTSVKAASFAFRFEGPDEVLLNAEVGRKFSQGGNQGGAFFEVSAESPALDSFYYRYNFSIAPPDPEMGVFLTVGSGGWSSITLDGEGYPAITPGLALTGHHLVLLFAQGNYHSTNATFNIKDTAVEDLLNEIALLIEEVAAKTAQIATLTAQVADLQAALQTEAGKTQAALLAHTQVLAEKKQLEDQLAAARKDLKAAEDLVAAHAQAIAGLQSQINIVTQQSVALTQSFQSAFADPTFALPGATSAEQIASVVDAILQLNPGQKKAIYDHLVAKKKK